MVRLISYADGPVPFYADETDLVIECPPEELGVKLAEYALFEHQKTVSRAVMVATSVQIASDSSDVVLIPYNHLVDGFRIEPELPYSLVFKYKDNAVTIPGTDRLEQPIPLGELPFSNLAVHVIRGGYEGVIRVHMNVYHCDSQLVAEFVRSELISIIAGDTCYSIVNGCIRALPAHRIRLNRLSALIENKHAVHSEPVSAEELSRAYATCTCRCPVHGARRM